jgi:hypothetical protein
MKSIAIAAVALTLCTIPVASFAQSKTPPTFTCRSLNSGETADATIRNTPVICHIADMGKIDAAMMAVMNDNLTAGQKAKLQAAMLVMHDELLLTPHYPGFNGDQNNR